MKILAVETSSEACSTALYVNGELIERFVIASRKHIEMLCPMVQEVVAESGITLSDLDGLAFGAGPGSFAGLRVACAFVQGLGSGLSLPIVPVSTLAAIAFHVLEDYPDKVVMVVLDAKMNEVYWGLYKRDGNSIITLINDQVSSVSDIPDLSKYDIAEEIIGAGDGWKLIGPWQEVISTASILDSIYPRAGEVALLAVDDLEKGLGLFADQVSPIYLRNNVALTIEEQELLRAKNHETKNIS